MSNATIVELTLTNGVTYELVEFPSVPDWSLRVKGGSTPSLRFDDHTAIGPCLDALAAFTGGEVMVVAVHNAAGAEAFRLTKIAVDQVRWQVLGSGSYVDTPTTAVDILDLKNAIAKVATS